MKQHLYYFTILITAVFGGILLSSNKVFANAGGGSSTSPVAAACSSPNGYQYLCGNPAGSNGGGGAWYLFKVDDNIVRSKNSLQDNDVAINCKKEGHYISFGYDQLHGSTGNAASGAGQYGVIPMSNSTKAGGWLSYNSYNALTLDSFKENGHVTANKITSIATYGGKRITWGAAKSIFNKVKASGDAHAQNYSWENGSDLAWFCLNPEIFSHPTYYQSTTTLSASASASKRSPKTKTVESGRDGNGWGELIIDGTNKVKLSSAHTLFRTDGEPYSVDKIYYKRANSGGTKTLSGSTSWNNTSFNRGNNSSQSVLSADHGDQTVDAGATEVFCMGLNHEIRVDVNDEGKRVDSNKGSTATSKSCLAVTNVSGITRDPTDPVTYPSYIGESTSVQYGQGQYHTYFYVGVGNSVAANEVSSTGSGAVQYYGGTSINVNPPVVANAQNVLCNHYSGIPRKSCTGSSDSSPTIYDDTRYVGAKICASSATTNSEWTGQFQTETYTYQRKDANGNTVTETKTIKHPIYKYYIKFSNAVCNPISKKPNFRATNGNVFADGSVKAIYAHKTKYYSSWSEYLSVVNQDVKVFGSGASFRNGSGTNNILNNSYLTIANKNTPVGHSGVSTTSDNFIQKLKAKIINNAERLNDRVELRILSDNETLTGNEIRPSDPNKQLIIYSSGNINIDQGVKTINAWVIAEGNINTCAGTTAENKSANSCANIPLTVNGIIYAQTIDLFRTVVGTGNGSADSAEIFNLPADSYRWSYDYAKNSARQANEVYVQELAPRG